MHVQLDSYCMKLFSSAAQDIIKTIVDVSGTEFRICITDGNLACDNREVSQSRFTKSASFALKLYDTAHYMPVRNGPVFLHFPKRTAQKSEVLENQHGCYGDAFCCRDIRCSNFP